MRPCSHRIVRIAWARINLQDLSARRSISYNDGHGSESDALFNLELREDDGLASPIREFFASPLEYGDRIGHVIEKRKQKDLNQKAASPLGVEDGSALPLPKLKIPGGPGRNALKHLYGGVRSKLDDSELHHEGDIVQDMLNERMLELETAKHKMIAKKVARTYIPERKVLLAQKEKENGDREVSEGQVLADDAITALMPLKKLIALSSSSSENLHSGKNESSWGNSGQYGAATEYASTEGEEVFGRKGGFEEANDQLPYLARCLQRAGLCSRREAITRVTSGAVKVNGEVIRDPFVRVEASDDILVAGHAGRLRFPPTQLWLYHKPAFTRVSLGGDGGIGRHGSADTATTLRLAQLIGQDFFIPIGTLPFHLHGVMCLTNDGDLARWMNHPSARIQSTYQLRVRPGVGLLLANKLNTKGISIGKFNYKGFEFLPLNERRSAKALRVKVYEAGNKLSIDKMVQGIGRRIIRGGRISFGPFKGHRLPPGGLREVTVPPFFHKHCSRVWQPFVERDWPYFRQRRLLRLRQMSRYRMLTDKERAEADTYAFEELQQAFNFQSTELEVEAQESLRALQNNATGVDEHEFFVNPDTVPSLPPSEVKFLSL